MAACQPTSGEQLGNIGYVQGYAGMVAAEEPRAALVAQDILTAGGTAADAAAAAYFALAVTMPSKASLGGGGVCVAFRGGEKDAKPEVLDFIATASQANPASADRPTAIPGNVRGMAALHARYGRLRWEQVVGPAEQLARLGTPMSRAFAADLAPIGRGLVQDLTARQVFVIDRRLAGEGDRIAQFDLAGTLSRIRAKGAGDFYLGDTARLLVDGVAQAGGTLTAGELRGFLPQWRSGVTVDLGRDVAHFATPPAAGGATAAQILSTLDSLNYDDANEATKAHLLAESAARVLAERASWMQPGGAFGGDPQGLVDAARIQRIASAVNPSRHQPVAVSEPPADNFAATSLVVSDREGSAVSCSFTMNNLFGTGRTAPGTGIFLAASPILGNGVGPYALGPVLVVNENVGELRLAAAASGGVAAPTALADVVARSMLTDQNIGAAVAAPRVHNSGTPDVTYAEAGAPVDQLRQFGHHVETVDIPSRVVALRCGSGRPGFERCDAASDPRGTGLGLVVGRD